MKILGVNTGHDAGAAIVEDGKILCCLNEERLSRKKMHWGVPYLSIKEALKIAKTRGDEIDNVAIANITQGGGISKSFKEAPFLKKAASYVSFFSFFRTHLSKNIYRFVFSRLRKEKELEVYLKKQGIGAPLQYFDHHRAHAATAYYASQFSEQNEKDVLIVTVDGAGDGLCSTISVIENKKMIKKRETVFYNSPTVIYSYITHNLGFKYLQHEGKITGLAAYGNPAKTIDIFRKIMDYDKDKLEFINRLGCWGRPAARKLHLMFQGYRREDIAAGVQQRLEEVVAGLISRAAKKYNKKLACLSGGAFANVKLNQRILELPEIEDIYIHQHMGDGGVGLGSALALWAEKDRNAAPRCLKNVYLGLSYSESDIETALKEKNLPYKRYNNIRQKIAELLAEGRIVARFFNAMEYGPRALGHRSILYKTDDQTVNDWLNKKLKRTEFMPFAPIVLRERANEYFKNFNQDESFAANFMIITYNVTDKCEREAPAITHIDGTARPQAVDKENNFDSWSILKEYEKITGRGILINTSFNMHGEPIVCAPEDAVKSFMESGLDALAIGDYIIE